jgi:membrane protein implicated in regulation of membrane protease activity
MTKELISHPWLFWTLIAVISAIIEVMAPSFSFIFIAFAGIIAAITALFTSWIIQVLAFALSLALSLLFLRPKFVERFHTTKKIFSRTGSLVGEDGIVTEPIGKVTTGRVLVSGQDWSAQSNKEISVGKIVIVDGSDGIVLNVREK